MAEQTVRRDQLIAVLDELMMLIAETRDYQPDETLQAALEEALCGLMALRRRLEVAERRYVVAVVGLSNVGKSTLLNALLGAELAPRRNGPCTAAPIEFAFGEFLRVTAFYRRAVQRPSWLCDDCEAVHQRLSALAADAGAVASQSLRKIVVEVPCGLLAEGLVVADTPGFGAAQSAEADGSHQAALKEYLNGAVSQVFMVVLAEQGIMKREQAFYEEFLASTCDDVIVTAAEDWSQGDQERFRRRFSQSFNRHLPPLFHFASGLVGLQARRSEDTELLMSAGIPALETRIRALADARARLEAIARALAQWAEDLSLWLAEFKNSRNQHVTNWWRPDSWLRWQELTNDNVLAKRLSAQLEVANTAQELI